MSKVEKIQEAIVKVIINSKQYRNPDEIINLLELSLINEETK